jgi:acyl transferase domain-containing protein
LLAGRDLVTPVESNHALLHPNKTEPGTSYTFAAGSIGDFAYFPVVILGVSPREAAQMEPQQRILLEMASEAFEHPPSEMRGSRCGVYVGLSSVDSDPRVPEDTESSSLNPAEVLPVRLFRRRDCSDS